MTDLTSTTQDAAPVSMSPGRVALRRAIRHGGFWIGGTIIFVIVLMAIFAPLLTPYDPSVQSLSEGYVPPVWAEAGSWSILWEPTILAGITCRAFCTALGSRSGSVF